jgi:hypothetical protein
VRALRAIALTLSALAAFSATAYADPPRRARGVETSAALSDPHVAGASVAPAGTTAAAPRRDPNTPRYWKGPRVEIGYVHYSLSDSNGGGPVNGISIGGYAPTGALRLGVLGDAGQRRYTFDEDDIALRVSAVVGYQALRAVRRLTPFVAARFDLGVLIRQRFNTTLADSMYGAGIEAGFEINPARSFHLGMAMGISVIESHGLSYVSWSLRAFFGL